MHTIRALLATLVCATLPVFGGAPAGAHGRVVDESGQPVPGAHACTSGASGLDLCDDTDSEGRYVLPASEERTVRIVARGFLPTSVAALPQTKPIVLSRAASLRIRLVDERTGVALPKGQVKLKYASGKELGPFPANSKGVSIATLPPGEVEPRGSADGYRDGSAPAVKLVAGEPAEVVLRLTRKGTEKP